MGVWRVGGLETMAIHRKQLAVQQQGKPQISKCFQGCHHVYLDGKMYRDQSEKQCHQPLAAALKD